MMALYHLMRRGALVPISSCHLLAQLTAKSVLQHLPSVHLAANHRFSKHYFSKKSNQSCCFLHKDYCNQSSKSHQADLVGHTAEAEKSFGNILRRDISKHLSLSPMKNTQLISNFSTSSVQGAEDDNSIGKAASSNSKQPLFDFFSVKSLLSAPTPYLFYGISGLIPFMSVPIYMFMTSSFYAPLAYAQLAYGACILSFLGGVAWGNDLSNSQQSTFKSLGYSVSLSLIGWLGVLAYPSVIAFPIVITGIGFAGYTDTQTMGYAQWFKNLRFLLSSLVVISLTSTYLIGLCS